jgi:pimeloyl-ACP methyl ester carboxylesterase
MDAKLNPTPRIQVPTLVLHGDGDAVNAPATSEGREAMFSGLYRRRLVPGAGHFPQREKPTFVASAMIEWLVATR